MRRYECGIIPSRCFSDKRGAVIASISAKIDVTLLFIYSPLWLIGAFAFMMAVRHHVALFHVEAKCGSRQVTFACSSAAHR